MAKVKDEGVVAVIGDICSDFTRGKIPLELIVRFRNDPWRHLEPLEVLETRFGELIPKDVYETSVRIAQNPDNGSSVAIGVRENGTFWSSASRVPNVPLDVKRLNGPFFPSVGRPQYIIAANGSVRSLHGGHVADKVLSNNPFIVYSANDRGVMGYESETSESRQCWLGHLFGEPVGAVFMNETFGVWNEHGTVYVAERGSSGDEHHFPFVPGQTVESVAKWSALVAIVFRFDGEKPYSKLVVLGHGGRIRMQTTEEHDSISTPLFRQDGTLFVRIDGALMRMGSSEKSFEKVREVTSDPWLTKEDIVCALVEEGIFQVFKDGYEAVTELPTPVSMNGSILWTPSNQMSGVEVRKVYENGSIGHEGNYEDVVHEGIKSLVTNDGYAFSCRTLTSKGARRVLSVVRCHDHPEPDSRSRIVGDEDIVFDLHQVVTRGTSVYAVMQKPGGGKDWCVVMNGHRDAMIQLGKAGDAIFGLAHWGPLLQWYRREGREIFLCRMYIGE